MATKFSPINGILIHRLPEKYQQEALYLFSELSVSDHNQDALGLKIYFEHYACARKTILWRRIMVREQYYDIYPLVTNLTIRGIRCHTSKCEIERLVQSYGPVFYLYNVNIFEEDRNKHKIVSLSDDCRVVLNVPEVLSNYRLEPIVLPEVKREFPVLFFCRLCRQNGHKQYQCPDTVKAGTGVSRPEAGPGPGLAKYRRRSEQIRRCESFEGYPNESDSSPKGDLHSGQCSPGITSEGTTWATYCGSPDYGNSVQDSRPSKIRRKSDFRYSSGHREKSSTASSSEPPFTCHYLEQYKSPSSRGQHQIHQPPNRHFDYHNFPRSISQSIPSTLCPRDNHGDAPKDVSFSKKLKCAKKQTGLPSNRPSQHDGVKKRKEHGTESLTLDRTRCERNVVRSETLDRHAKNSVKDSTDVKVELLGNLCGAANKSPMSPGDTPTSSKSESYYNTTISMKVRSEHLEDSEASTSKGSSREGLASHTADSFGPIGRRKERKGVRLSLLTPPDTEPERVLQLIRHVYDAEEIPQKMEQELEALLGWIQGPDRPKLSGKEAAVVQHLRHYLNEIHSSRIKKEAEEPVADALPKQELNTEKEDAVPPSTPRKKVRCRRTSICQAVVDIIKGIDGELSPILLENFLRQVRGRRKQADMARIFTSNMPGLIFQLRQVERAYYTSGRRSSEEEIDIRFIKDLYKRLERDISAESHPLVKTELGSVLVKSEPA